MTAERQKCLTTLGLTLAANEDDIKKAYKKLALQYHPDKNDDEDAKNKFQKISYAYKYLTDGPPGLDRGDHNDHDGDFLSELFKEMFFSHTMFGGGGGRHFPQFDPRFGFYYESEDDDDLFYSDSEDDLYGYHSRQSYCAEARPRQNNAEARPRQNNSRTYQYTPPPAPPVSKKKMRKQEKRRRQRERQKEKKKSEKNENAHANTSSTDYMQMHETRGPSKSPTTDKDKSVIDERERARKEEMKRLEEEERVRNKEKKKLEEQEKRRIEQEAREIAASVVRKNKEKQEKEMEKKKEQEKKAAKEENDDIPDWIYAHIPKSQKDRKREKKRETDGGVPVMASGPRQQLGKVRARNQTVSEDRCTGRKAGGNKGGNVNNNNPRTKEKESNTDKKRAEKETHTGPSITQRTGPADNTNKMCKNRFNVLDSLDGVEDDVIIISDSENESHLDHVDVSSKRNLRSGNNAGIDKHSETDGSTQHSNEAKHAGSYTSKNQKTKVFSSSNWQNDAKQKRPAKGQGQPANHGKCSQQSSKASQHTKNKNGFNKNNNASDGNFQNSDGHYLLCNGKFPQSNGNFRQPNGGRFPPSQPMFGGRAHCQQYNNNQGFTPTHRYPAYQNMQNQYITDPFHQNVPSQLGNYQNYQNLPNHYGHFPPPGSVHYSHTPYSNHHHHQQQQQHYNHHRGQHPNYTPHSFRDQPRFTTGTQHTNTAGNQYGVQGTRHKQDGGCNKKGHQEHGGGTSKLYHDVGDNISVISSESEECPTGRRCSIDSIGSDGFEGAAGRRLINGERRQQEWGGLGAGVGTGVTQDRLGSQNNRSFFNDHVKNYYKEDPDQPVPTEAV